MACSLPYGLILEVLERAGVESNGDGDKRTCRCPLHDDKTPSAFANAGRNVFHCSVCGSFTTKQLAGRLSVPWPLPQHGKPMPAMPTMDAEKNYHPPFTPDDAWCTYEPAVRRAYELRGTSQGVALKFLSQRGLIAALEREPMFALCGILSGISRDLLPPAVRNWPGRGYQLVCGLWSVETGEIQAVAARDVSGIREKRLMCPRGSTISGSVFASPNGRDLLRGEIDVESVLYGEGLTDMLSLALCTDIPVLTVPGVTMAPKAVGAWARGRTVLIAIDADAPSEEQVKPTAVAIARYDGRAIRVHWPRGCKDANDSLLKLGVDGLRAQLAAFREAVAA